MKKFLFFPFLFLMLACATQKRCNDRFPQQSFDSVVMKTVTIYRDTTVFFSIPADTVHDTIRVLIDNNGLINSDVSFLQTQFAESRAFVNDGKLVHTLVQKDAEVSKTIEGAIQKMSSFSQSNKEVANMPLVLTPWQNFLIICGKFLLSSVVLFIILMLLRYFLKGLW
jgi:hypothetical protein